MSFRGKSATGKVKEEKRKGRAERIERAERIGTMG